MDAAAETRERSLDRGRQLGFVFLVSVQHQITQTEIDLAECQQRFADAEHFNDASSGRKLHEAYDALSAKLQALEAEYFAREP